MTVAITMKIGIQERNHTVAERDPNNQSCKKYILRGCLKPIDISFLPDIFKLK